MSKIDQGSKHRFDDEKNVELNEKLLHNFEQMICNVAVPQIDNKIPNEKRQELQKINLEWKVRVLDKIKGYNNSRGKSLLKEAKKYSIQLVKILAEASESWVKSVFACYGIDWEEALKDVKLNRTEFNGSTIPKQLNDFAHGRNNFESLQRSVEVLMEILSNPKN